MLEEIAKVLVDAGATHASAARAAVIIDTGGSIADAHRELVIQETPATFDVQLLMAEVRRLAGRVTVPRG